MNNEDQKELNEGCLKQFECPRQDCLLKISKRKYRADRAKITAAGMIILMLGLATLFCATYMVGQCTPYIR